MGMFLGRFRGNRNSFFTKHDARYKKYDIGDFTYGRPTVYDWNDGTTLKIGRYCSIADEVRILLGGNHRMDRVSTYPFSEFRTEFPEAHEITGHPASKGAINIGNDVWIGNGVTILSGVTIGDGACIAAGTVVSKDVGPYEVVGGNPQKRLKLRFDEKLIEALLRIRWWEWEQSKIRKYVHLILADSPQSFVKQVESNNVQP